MVPEAVVPRKKQGAFPTESSQEGQGNWRTHDWGKRACSVMPSALACSLEEEQSEVSGQKCWVNRRL